MLRLIIPLATDPSAQFDIIQTFQPPRQLSAAESAGHNLPEDYQGAQGKKKCADRMSITKPERLHLKSAWRGGRFLRGAASTKPSSIDAGWKPSKSSR